MDQKDANRPSMATTMVRMGLAFGLLFGVMMALWCWLTFDMSVMAALAVGGLQGIFGGLFYGLFMGVALGGLQAYATTANGQDVSAPLHANHTVFLELSVNEALALAERALAELPGPMERIEGPEGGIREVRTSPSLKSFGEVVQVSATRLNGVTALSLSSRPRLTTTQIDYGVNDLNVRKLGDAIRAAYGREHDGDLEDRRLELEAELTQARLAALKAGQHS